MNRAIKLLNKGANKLGYSIIDTKASAILTQNNLTPYFSFFGMNVVWGNWNQVDYIQQGFLKNAGLYSIVNRITATSAQAAETFKVFRVKSESKARQYRAMTGKGATKESSLKGMQIKSDAYEEMSNHPFNELLEHPNEWQQLNEFIQNSIGFKLLTGNRFLWLNILDMGANSGRPKGIYNLPTANMTIRVGSTMWDVVGYELHLGAKKVDFPKEQIIHSRYWNPEFDGSGSHLWGLSPLRAGQLMLGLGNEGDLRAYTMLKNAGAAGVIFSKSIEEMSEQQASDLKYKLNTEVIGSDKAGKIAIANGDMGYLKLGLSTDELKVIELLEYSMQTYCNLYKAPPGLFMASANATDNNIKEWNRQLITQCCLPALSELRDDLQKILDLWGDGAYVDYAPHECFPELQEDQNQLAITLEKSPYLTGNEKRIARGFDEDLNEPMMGRYLYPSGLVDISTLDPTKIEEQMNLIDEQMRGMNGNGQLNGQQQQAQLQ